MKPDLDEGSVSAVPRGMRSRMIAATLIVVLLVLTLFIGGSRAGGQSEVRSAEVAEGLAWLRRQEARDPAAVEQSIKAIQRAERERMLQLQRDEWVAQLQSGAINVWSLFDDAVILGDSRAVGFSFYDYLPGERVLAEGGATIRNVEALIPELQQLNPDYIFLCYGLNDISIGYWSTAEEYTAELAELLEQLQNAIPEAQICVSSTLIARDPAFQTASVWRKIPEWNQSVEQMCAEKGYAYADNRQLCEDYAQLWETDGIHVQRGFYPHWAENLMIEVYDYELGKMETDAD